MLFDVLADSRGDATGSETAGVGLGPGAWYSVVQPIEDDGAALVEDDGAALGEEDGAAFVVVDGVALGEEDGVALGGGDGVAYGVVDGVALGEEDGVAFVVVDGVAIGEVDLFSVVVEEGPCTVKEPPRSSVQLDEGDSLETLYPWYATLGGGMGLTDGDVFGEGCWSRGQVHNETL